MRTTGKVKWFNDAKGFGFITPTVGGEDIFCHYSGIKGKGHRTLADGDEVEFTVIEGTKGKQATEVQKVA